LVYASKRSNAENEWWYQCALFDIEKFYYRTNGNVELVKDTAFSLDNYPDQNVIVFGNGDNNAAWKSILNSSPIQVIGGKLILSKKSLTGAQWGTYFIVP
jgi:hypothetical protein